MTWVPDQGLVKLLDQVDDAWPGRSRASDGMLGNAAHAARVSDHNPEHPAPRGNPDYQVDALDITHDPQHGPDCQALADAIIASRDRRVKHLIHNRRICAGALGPSPWVWRTYTGPNPHTGHLHISVLDGTHDQAHDWAIGDDMQLEDNVSVTDALAAAYSLDATEREKITVHWLLTRPAVAARNALSAAQQAQSYATSASAQAKANGESLSYLRSAVAELAAQVVELKAALAALGGTVATGTVHVRIEGDLPVA